MRRASLFSAVAILACAFAPAPAAADFGIENAEVFLTEENSGVVNPLTQAGRHPFEMKVNFDAKTTEDPRFDVPVPDGAFKDLFVTQIRGLAGNPTAVEPCSSVDFLAEGEAPKCAPSSALGLISLRIIDPTNTEFTPLYNLEPAPGKAAKFGFAVASVVRVTVEIEAKPTPPYNLIARSSDISNVVFFYGAELSLWGVPADPAHDPVRGKCVNLDGSSNGLCPAGVDEEPFLTVPRACEGPLFTHFEGFSWEGDTFFEEVLSGDPLGFGECLSVGFSPDVAAEPTTDRAESPSGLEFTLRVEDEGLLSPTGTAESDIKKSVVTLPEGVTLNPSVAEGLAVCTPQNFAAESRESDPGEGCPEASKVGTVEATTPLLEGRVLRGSLFVASQNDNPFNSLIALYMVIREPELGLFFKLAGKVEPDPKTGQIVSSFDELPPYPLGEVHVRLREGGRSPLITPPRCGAYETKVVFTPYANPDHPLTKTTSFQISKGVGGGPCPSGATPPFEPGFSAGTLNNNAGAYSPFLMDLQRRDGDQDLVRFDATLPQGALAKLAGVAKCPDSAIAQIKTKTGRQEQANPSCPADSRIGSVVGGAGVGSQLTYARGAVYLAGPFGGAPLSVVGVVPAVAGPFDVGVIATRQALTLDPRTAQPRVDGALSDPIPHILAGIPLKVRDIYVDIDRPEFTLNPTGCRKKQVEASIWGGGADPFSLFDDAPVARQAPFRAANCARLGFKPRLSINLKGGTRRGSHPALRAVVRPRPGDANFSEAVVTLPRSAFLDQGHIRTICTRVQFTSGLGHGANCPKGAIYGRAKAFTPLLEEPFSGPVFLRSSDNKLPDLVIALHGLVDVELSSRLDSHRGGIRSTFTAIPDAPVSRFVLEMQGGKKGLIVNSRNLCARKSRADARLSGQNGRGHDFRSVVRASGCQ